ncbi:QueT transporter family protein [Murdochiella vaginalis]|uniref:QueT transporter family protein n=1 Tax=Murdochiella vaginalis TaxID=1852373 RepID=UPI0008FE1649|nr:QueT transporter family protein [Murdochiella vaginalis]
MNKTQSYSSLLSARTMARQGIIAAVYVIFTLSGFGFSYGPVQFRYAEVMTWLAFFDPKNVIGLTLGCLVANIWSPFGAIDMIVGTLGTLLSTLLMAKVSSKWIASLFPAAFSFLYSGEAWFLGEITGDLFPLVTAQIMLSQFIITAIIGLPLWTVLWRNKLVREALADPVPARDDKSGRGKIIS